MQGDLKLKVKKAVSYVNDFEEAVAQEARRRGHHGVVCGHIHRAEMREIEGVLYCNDGDWVESCTALVEHKDGTFEILNWNKPRTAQITEERYAHSDRDRRLVPAGERGGSAASAPD